MGPYSTVAAGRPVYKEVQYEMQVYPLFRLSFEMSKQFLVRQPAPANADGVLSLSAVRVSGV
jgi:hypothetical protein